MTDQASQMVSSMVDDELNDADISQLIQRLNDDEEMQRCWRDYHLISDALNNNLPNAIQHNLAQSVSDAVHDERPLNTPVVIPLSFSTLGSSKTSKNSPALQRLIPVARYAMAASLAALAVVGFQWINQDAGFDGALEHQRLANAPIGTMPSAAEYRRVADTYQSAASPEVQSQLYNYLINHDAYSVSSGAAQGGGKALLIKMVDDESTR
ncbi:MAG: sigma-E factor negative regulatory protein [Gammaproteobacteria bacterium]|nr:sigma-E factor negative regulatory protein [Gammaproteobacteria bacterium]